MVKLQISRHDFAQNVVTFAAQRIWLAPGGDAPRRSVDDFALEKQRRV
jgi:hypothetical protein